MDDQREIIGKLDKLMSELKSVRSEVQTIKRGVYGDDDNDVPGLIDHQRNHLERIMSLEETRKKAFWFGTGAIVVLQVLWHFIVDWFKKL